MPFYHPFTDAKTNGEATEGNRHVELHGPLCGAAEEVAREGGAVRRRVGRKERNPGSDYLSLGTRYQGPINREVPGTRYRPENYSVGNDAKAVVEKNLENFIIFEKKLLTSFITCDKIPSVKPTALRNIQTTPKTGTCLARLHIRQ